MNEVYSIREIAAAARCPEELVRQVADFEQVLVVDDLLTEADAVRLVRSIRRTPGGRPPLSFLPPSERRTTGSLAISGSLHAAFVVLLLVASSLEWLEARPEDRVPPTPPPKLVFLISPGPGGGGGGGGLAMPAPPPRAERKAPAPRKVSSPVPPPRRYVAPPRPQSQQIPKPPVRPTLRDTPTPTPPPAPPAQAVQAPVAALEADTRDVVGVVDAPPAPPSAPPSQGPGTGGGVGTGQGEGIGEGSGGGIGPGSGGGTGGGPYRPGSGIEPPQLLKEVRPLYTDDARRRAVQGDVVLEIVVRRDGSVGDVRVTRPLGSGLDQRAVAAVRQWRFSPAKRQGAPVDVIVEVAVGFTLR
ncbi:MAG: TonB family protein [Vicinamibacterales bacterium]